MCKNKQSPNQTQMELTGCRASCRHSWHQRTACAPPPLQSEIIHLELDRIQQPETQNLTRQISWTGKVSIAKHRTHVVVITVYRTQLLPITPPAKENQPVPVTESNPESTSTGCYGHTHVVSISAPWPQSQLPARTITKSACGLLDSSSRQQSDILLASQYTGNSLTQVAHPTK